MSITCGISLWHLWTFFTAVGAIHDDRSLNNIFWLHIPKTGTSFGNLIMTIACPQIPDSRLKGTKLVNLVQKGKPEYLCDPHDCCPKAACVDGVRKMRTCKFALMSHFSFRKEYVRSTYAMLREPVERLLSYLYMHDKKFKTLQSRSERESYIRRKCMDPATGVLMLNYIVGGSAQTYLSSKSKLLMGLKILHSLPFVGVTERWEESVSKFRNVTQTPGHPSDHVNNRKSIESDLLTTEQKKERATNILDNTKQFCLHRARSWPDSILFREANDLLSSKSKYREEVRPSHFELKYLNFSAIEQTRMSEKRKGKKRRKKIN